MHSSLFLVLPLASTVLMACSAAPQSSGDPSAPAMLTDTLTPQGTPVTPPQSPLFTITYEDPSAGIISVHAAEVDPSGNTFVLAHSVRDINFVYAFDPRGVFVSKAEVRGGQYLDEALVRIGAAGFAVVGTQSDPGVSPRAPKVYVDRFDAASNRVFAYTIGGASSSGADLCADGSTAVAVSTGSDAVLYDLDATGAVRWTQGLENTLLTKVRCTSDGHIVVSGLAGTVATAAQFDGAGVKTWQWSGADTASLPITLDLDAAGDMFVGATTANGYAVYGIGAGGNQRWAWQRGGGGVVSGLSVSDVVAVTGSTGTAELDSSGNVLWNNLASEDGVALDSVDEAFTCGAAGSAVAATLYGAGGAPQWTYPTALWDAQRTNVTSGVGRCIGTQGNGIGIVGLQVR